MHNPCLPNKSKLKAQLYKFGTLPHFCIAYVGSSTLFIMKNWMPKYKIEYGLKPTQSIGDRCVRGGWCFVCINVTKWWFIYRTVLEKSVFLEGEF